MSENTTPFADPFGGIQAASSCCSCVLLCFVVGFGLLMGMIVFGAIFGSGS